MEKEGEEFGKRGKVRKKKAKNGKVLSLWPLPTDMTERAGYAAMLKSTFLSQDSGFSALRKQMFVCILAAGLYMLMCCQRTPLRGHIKVGAEKFAPACFTAPMKADGLKNLHCLNENPS